MQTNNVCVLHLEEQERQLREKCWLLDEQKGTIICDSGIPGNFLTTYHVGLSSDSCLYYGALFSLLGEEGAKMAKARS